MPITFLIEIIGKHWSNTVYYVAIGIEHVLYSDTHCQLILQERTVIGHVHFPVSLEYHIIRNTVGGVVHAYIKVTHVAEAQVVATSGGIHPLILDALILRHIQVSQPHTGIG